MRERSIEYYMSLPYRIELIPDAEEGRFALRCPELPGCITCAETIDEGYAMLEDAKERGSWPVWKAELRSQDLGGMIHVYETRALSLQSLR